ncbi:META domain-containing protein [Algoriphagus halophilus]|nr:META domain-containing protein [Algoriphagus halophilus]
MKLIFPFHILIIIFLMVSAGCKTTQPSTNMKANLLDGEWEANYIMGTPKGMQELFPNGNPTVTFQTAENSISGFAGCNIFNGSFSTDGNKITIPENLAVTRKMCPDISGENTFLESLHKVNSYSVTEQGNTLNLIMGDMAIMRLTRK